MENVPDMALDREMFILRTMVHELETLGYAVEERVVDTSRVRRSAVPPAPHPGRAARRRRVPAGRRRLRTRSPCGTPSVICPRSKAGGDPEGGADGWADYDGPVTAFQRRMREGMDGADAGKVYRPHHPAGA